MAAKAAALPLLTHDQAPVQAVKVDVSINIMSSISASLLTSTLNSNQLLGSTALTNTIDSLLVLNPQSARCTSPSAKKRYDVRG